MMGRTRSGVPRWESEWEREREWRKWLQATGQARHGTLGTLRCGQPPKPDYGGWLIDGWDRMGWHGMAWDEMGTVR